MPRCWQRSHHPWRKPSRTWKWPSTALLAFTWSYETLSNSECNIVQPPSSNFSVSGAGLLSRVYAAHSGRDSRSWTKCWNHLQVLQNVDFRLGSFQQWIGMNWPIFTSFFWRKDAWSFVGEEWHHWYWELQQESSLEDRSKCHPVCWASRTLVI